MWLMMHNGLEGFARGEGWVRSPRVHHEDRSDDWVAVSFIIEVVLPVGSTLKARKILPMIRVI